MTRWDCRHVSDPTEEMVAEIGGDGWELVSVVHETGVRESDGEEWDSWHYFFKRQRPEETTHEEAQAS